MMVFAIGASLAIYFFLPFQSNLLLLGIDYTEPGSVVGRSDTIILATVVPMKRYIGLLSVPRDLWVVIPGIGQNRINTAHFYAEIQQPGNGPNLAIQTIRLNFGLDMNYFLRIRFEGFREVINAIGGIDIELTEPMAGYEPGKYHLTGNKALAFVRNRMSSDDFHRMQQGQFFLKTVLKNILKPKNLPRIPKVIQAFFNSVDTNVPMWMWPRFAVTLLLVGPNGIDNQIISSEMVTPFTTSEGASVLAPNWDLINPLTRQMFAQ